MTNTPAAIALNSTPFRAKFEDGHEEDIQIKHLTNREVYKYIKAVQLDDMPSVVAFCCGKPVEWIDTLDIGSYAEIAGIVAEQNFHRAMVIASRDPVAGAAMLKASATLDEVMAMATPMILQSISPGQSPAPASLESAAATGSESLTSPQGAPAT